jgi:hypothetical protein
MLHEIAVQLGQHLQYEGCPIPVIDGPEFRPTTTFARERIVIEHDLKGDAFVSRHRADVNPRTRLTRNMAAKATLYCKSTRPGAIYWEHVRRVEHLLDLVIISLDVIAKERQNLIQFKSGSFLYPEDFKSETPGGAVYELLFSFDRGVVHRTWLFGIGPTATVVATTGTEPGQVTIVNSATAAGATEDGGTSTEDI